MYACRHGKMASLKIFFDQPDFITEPLPNSVSTWENCVRTSLVPFSPLPPSLPPQHSLLSLHPSRVPHRVVVTATNRDGSTGPEMTSDPVEISITTLAVGPPQIPDKPTISMITNTSARLSWTDPGVYMCVCVCVKV